MPSASYDSVVYDASAHTHTHPTRLATMAYLMGLEPPSLYNARVLELGCATGNNLLPMAEGYPDATFVGIDYSVKQIETGRARIAASGLKNLELEHRSISDITDADGKFDYIIAHGVYSWIPKGMQDALLRVCSRNLADNGVAYISYNTLPGWSLTGLVRDVMLFHTRNLPEAEKTPHARAILEFLSKYSPADTPYGQLLRDTSSRLSKIQDYYLAHEYLEADNEAIHFHTFVDRIRKHDLEYLSDVEIGSTLPNLLPPDVLGILGKLSKDFVEYEQYLDFLRARTFRQSLVVHADAPIVRQVSLDRLASLSIFPTFISSVPMHELQGDDKTVRFSTINGQTVESNDPVFKGLIRFAAEAMPVTVTVEQVIAGVPRIGTPLSEAQWREGILARIFEAFSGGIVRLVRDPPLGDHGTIDERPKASLAARAEASFGQIVTVKGHQGSTMDHFHLAVLALLDGTRTQDDLVQHFLQSHRRGEFKFNDGTSSMPEAIIASKLSELVETVLRDVRSAGLLRA
jgi:methyltransferase-like protein/ubiquinone/menaquinone biosynthesis C-methylase UbiE